jgi:hypothetical protein
VSLDWQSGRRLSFLRQQWWWLRTREDLREAAQNPIADLISVPFQNNTNFDIGHTDNTQNVLNIQPVYPVHLNPNWNLITRPILPVISQPPFLSGPELHAAEQVFGP